jgi:hypothetical protein
VGRHSLDDQAVFWRSAVLFALKWLAIGVLPLLVILGIVRLVTQGGGGETVETQPPAATSPIPTSTVEEQASPTQTVQASPSPQASPASQKKLTIQVLNGSNTEGNGNLAAAELRKEGYEIVAVTNAARKYEKTTVFYQPGFEKQADDVARLVGADVVEAAPENLDKNIPVTVVIGNDYKP